MLPAQIIKNEERKIKENLRDRLASIIDEETKNFTEKTGLLVTAIHFNFLDASTFTKREMILSDDISIYVK